MIRDIPGYENLYGVTEDGRIWSFIRSRWLHPYDDGRGYPAVTLHRRGKKREGQLHRLVALTFIPNPEGKREVNHINGIKSDNRISNLEWCTGAENFRHAIETGLFRHHIGVLNPSSKLTEEDVLEIRKASSSKKFSARQMAKRYGVHLTTIHDVIQRKSWRHL